MNDKYIEQTWQPTYNYKNTNMPIILNSFLQREFNIKFEIEIYFNHTRIFVGKNVKNGYQRKCITLYTLYTFYAYEMVDRIHYLDNHLRN